MSPHPVLRAVEHRAHLQIQGCEAAEGPLHRTETLIGLNRSLGIQLLLGQAGAPEGEAGLCAVYTDKDFNEGSTVNFPI